MEAPFAVSVTGFPWQTTVALAEILMLFGEITITCAVAGGTAQPFWSGPACTVYTVLNTGLMVMVDPLKFPGVQVKLLPPSAVKLAEALGQTVTFAGSTVMPKTGNTLTSKVEVPFAQPAPSKPLTV